MKKTFFYCSVLSVLTGICLSLGWHHHQIRPLSSIAPLMLPAFEPENKMLDISIKPLSEDESKKLLGHNLPSKGVVPLHITIQNNSPYEYSISPDTVDLNSMESKQVAQKIRKSALPRSIAFKIMGFIFWPFMIPGTIDTIHTFHSYKSLKRDYAAKSMKDELVPVYSTVNRILFVPQEEYKQEFTMTLMEKEKSKAVVFYFSAADAPKTDPELPAIPEQDPTRPA
jgi:hypothetical protein